MAFIEVTFNRLSTPCAGRASLNSVLAGGKVDFTVAYAGSSSRIRLTLRSIGKVIVAHSPVVRERTFSKMLCQPGFVAELETGILI
jgi:hypothetical protein